VTKQQNEEGEATVEQQQHVQDQDPNPIEREFQ
jgi:hypothetical protein